MGGLGLNNDDIFYNLPGGQFEIRWAVEPVSHF